MFQQNQDITSTFSNLTMNPKEGAVITFGISREVDIPLEFLNDGQNQLRLTLTGEGFIIGSDINPA